MTSLLSRVRDRNAFRLFNEKGGELIDGDRHCFSSDLAV